jgi:multiple sugar transport system substrate-binding protein
VPRIAAFLQGQTAMTISWPPYGRWAEGYGTDQEALNWVPMDAAEDYR